MRYLRAFGRRLAWPVRRLLDPRFADVNRRVDGSIEAVVEQGAATRRDLAAHVSEMGAELAHHVTDVLAPQVTTAVEQVEKVVGEYAVVNGEGLSIVGSELRLLADEVREAAQQVEGAVQEVRTAAASQDEKLYVERLNHVADAPVEELDGALANVLNVSQGHRGFAAQRELWLNPPLSLEYSEGDVRLGSVNERIVEPAYAFRALARVAPPARLLDVGSVESSVALTVASLGYEVTALDLRPYPFRHPQLTAVEARLEEWTPGEGLFDAILCISTIEHIGLGWYGEEHRDEDGDRRALDRLKTLLSEDGFLVLTVPYGRRSIDEVQRVYDHDALQELLAGWRIDDLTVVEQSDPQTWERVDSSAERAVAMVVAYPDDSR